MYQCLACGETLPLESTLKECGRTLTHARGTLLYGVKGSTPSSCRGALVLRPTRAPAAFCHGCPSYTFKREASEKAVAKETNRRFNDRNQDEISYSAKHNWKLLDPEKADKGNPEGPQRVDTSKLKEVSV
jgi:hypothetical protein